MSERAPSVPKTDPNAVAVVNRVAQLLTDLADKRNLENIDPILANFIRDIRHMMS